jgi:lipoic acid synthetase
MIMGNLCTRHCLFCGVDKGFPSVLDENEPAYIAAAAKCLKLDYIVITSVTRDDLADGGAAHFAKVINAVRSENDQIKIEVLIPDFKGNDESLTRVLDAKPYVLNHNIETIPGLYGLIRPEANYARSLNILRKTKQYSPQVYTKSGFMVGLGESRQNIFGVLNDLKNVDCDMVTIGQYLSPSKDHFPVQRFVDPDEYLEYQEFGSKLGLKVFAGAFVRSSYHAKELVNEKI